MYLRRVQYEDGVHYVLRQTHSENGTWKYRELMDLGRNPALHIHYPGGNGFYINPEIEESLSSMNVSYTSEELEEVFMPFMRHRTREVLERYKNVHRPLNLSKACPFEELWDHEKELHVFDKRRLHFLRFGRIDIGPQNGRSWKFLNVLLCKSRDEIESYIEAREQKLRAGEIVSYIYASFNLQSYFSGHIMRHHPVGLNTEKLDQYFMEEICRLNSDPLFFAGMDDHDDSSLHHFLVKYVILYFDNRVEADFSMEEYIRRFRKWRQFYRQSSLQYTMSVEDALVVFRISAEEFQRMTRKDLVRTFRRKAKNRHPDKGGEHDDFVRFTEAYETLLARK